MIVANYGDDDEVSGFKIHTTYLIAVTSSLTQKIIIIEGSNILFTLSKIL
jgi:hypothetical protein